MCGLCAAGVRFPADCPGSTSAGCAAGVRWLCGGCAAAGACHSEATSCLAIQCDHPHWAARARALGMGVALGPVRRSSCQRKSVTAQEGCQGLGSTSRAVAQASGVALKNGALDTGAPLPTLGLAVVWILSMRPGSHPPRGDRGGRAAKPTRHQTGAPLVTACGSYRGRAVAVKAPAVEPWCVG